MVAECWQALAEREENVRNGRLTTIIYIRDKNGRGQEISGYIDYAHRSMRFQTFEHVILQMAFDMPLVNA